MNDYRALVQGQVGDFRGEVQVLITKLDEQTRAAEVRKKALDEAEAKQKQLIDAVQNQSSVAGATFEARVTNALIAFAAKRGDKADPTGTKTESDGKAGDIVYTLNLDGAFQHPVGIALELKNEPVPLAGPSAFRLDELDRAMANRQCAYGIVVASLEKNRDERGPLFPYVQQIPGNRFVVLVDEDVRMPVALEAVIQSIATAARLGSATPLDRLNLEALNEGIDHAVHVKDLFRSLKTNMTATIQSLKKERAAVDRMEELLDDAVTELRRAVEKALQEGGAHKAA